MVVAFDNTVLSLLLHPEADPPFDPTTGAPVDERSAPVSARRAPPASPSAVLIRGRHVSKP